LRPRTAAAANCGAATATATSTAPARATESTPAFTAAVPASPSTAAAAAAAVTRAVPTVVRECDIVISDGTAFNGRGYRVCGVANKRGFLCGRIGTCPFHAQNVSSDAALPAGAAAAATAATATTSPAAARSPVLGPALDPETVQAVARSAIRLPVAPAKTRFKRSWTRDEHSRFLVALAKHGRGKWKEMAQDVGSRNGSQCQSHACKYFKRQAKAVSDRKKHSIHDMSVPEIPSQPAGAAADAAAALRKDAQLLMPGVEEGDTVFEPPAAAAADADVTFLSAPDPRVSVTVYLNNCPRAGRRMLLPESMACDEFLAAGAVELGVPTLALTRMFTRSGMEIEALDSVIDGDTLWLSDGAAFACAAPDVGAGADREDSEAGPEDEVTGAGVATAEDRIAVVVRLNGAAPGAVAGRTVLLPASMGRSDFLTTVAAAFGRPANLTRIFTRSGSEIEALDEILDGEGLWVSDGPDFSYGAL
jgi:SHAQKYF class myb-like DNA-binding protein